MNDDICYANALALISKFRAKEVSPVEVLLKQLDRADTFGAPVNAFSEVLRDEAIVQAREAEQVYLRASDDETLPPLLGVTVSPKEKHQMQGKRLEQGLLGHETNFATHDHPLIERLKQSGAVLHARTTTPEFSCATVTHSLLWGVTRNPWNLNFSPGGSSGGSGAALAAGLTTLATASDIAGSTRLPAAFTGTVGYKAPNGRIPGDGFFASDWYRGDGPMARTVADTALLANVLSGKHRNDPASLLKAVDIDGRLRPRRPLRIALSIGFSDFQVDPAVETNTRRIAKLLADAGHEVVEIDLPISRRDVHRIAFTHFGNLLAQSMVAPLARAGCISPYTQRFMDEAEEFARNNTFLSATEGEYRIQQTLADVFDHFHVLLCPTSAVEALEADANYVDGLTVNGTHLDYYWEGHMTLPFNIANRHPVLSVPSGFGTSGVPTGVQIVAPPFAEQLVFSVGHEIELIEQWHLRFADIGNDGSGSRYTIS